jgi:hypothetical protein
VVDAEHLRLVEHRQHLAVELQRLGKPRSERLLDHHPHLGLGVTVEAVLAELPDDHREERGCGGQVEEPVERDAGFLVELLELLVEPLVDGVVVEGARHVADLLEQLLEHLRVGLAARVLLDRLARHRAVVVVRDVRARHSDQVEALRQRPLMGQVVDRRQQLAVGEVPRAAEDDHRRRVDREPLQSLDERVLLLDDRHRATPRVAASAPRGRRRARRALRTGCAARR